MIYVYERQNVLYQNGSAPKRLCVKTALRQNVLRQNGRAKMFAPNRRRQNVLLRLNDYVLYCHD